MTNSRHGLLIQFFFIFIIPWLQRASAQDLTLPYPQSQIISGIEMDWSSHQRHAMGSDNFQLTWADDGHQYGIWGDGGGFKGSNSQYRVSFGVARIEGSYDNYTGFDRSGHPESAESESKMRGKSWAIICVDGDLYAWVHPDRKDGLWGAWVDHHKESRLYRSMDKGATWQAAEWAFTPDDGLTGGGILQFGQNYQGARDDYVYHYFVHPSNLIDPVKGESEIMQPGQIYLARVPKDQLLERPAYTFFKGFKKGKAVWTRKVRKKKPVFLDQNGVGTPMGISYVPGLKRYLLSTGHLKGHSGMLGIFKAPAPWGPWSTVYYADENSWFGHDFKPEIVPPTTFFWCIPTKWISDDGRSATLVFTGGWETGGPFNDSFNTVRIRLKP